MRLAHYAACHEFPFYIELRVVQLWLSWCMMIKMDQMTLWQIIYFHLAFHKYASLSHKCEMLVLLFIQPFARITVNEIPFGPTPTKLFKH